MAYHSRLIYKLILVVLVMISTGRPIVNIPTLIHKLNNCNYGVFRSDKMAHQLQDPKEIHSSKKII